MNLFLWDENNKIASIGFYLIAFSIIAFNLSLGADLQPDSKGYIPPAMLTRGPGYPAFLGLCFLLFGENNFFAVVLVQLLLGFSLINYVSNKLCKIFDLPKLLGFVICLTIFIPYYLHSGTMYGNIILTETLAYPLFFVVMVHLITFILNNQLRSFIYFAVTLTILMLVRGQFLFVVALFVMVYAYLLLFKRKESNLLLIGAIFFASLLTWQLTERAYMYSKSGNFKTVPFTGVQIINAPLYIADKEDESVFDSELEKKIFAQTYEELTKKGITANTMPEAMYPHHHFYYSYGDILYGTLYDVLYKNGVKDSFEIDKITVSISISLIKDNFIKYIKLFKNNYLKALGGEMVFLLILSLFLIAFLRHIKLQDKESFLFMMVITAHLGNYALIALAEPMLIRYTLYTDMSVLIMALIIAYKSFLPKK